MAPGSVLSASSPTVTVVPVADMPPIRVVVAWREGDTNPLLRSLVRIAVGAYPCAR